MLAAAATYALEHHIEGLNQDQENAGIVARGLLDIFFCARAIQ